MARGAFIEGSPVADREAGSRSCVLALPQSTRMEVEATMGNMSRTHDYPSWKTLIFLSYFIKIWRNTWAFS